MESRRDGIDVTSGSEAKLTSDGAGYVEGHRPRPIVIKTLLIHCRALRELGRVPGILIDD